MIYGYHAEDNGTKPKTLFWLAVMVVLLACLISCVKGSDGLAFSAPAAGAEQQDYPIVSSRSPC
ncbi:hypothetical protein ACP3TJ_03785 [Desulforudis sp. 1088]|uniref:hypothetical protein n=1 Tax=unclassified Candidatus Desulforudis TaxID=2635950 RepID=UPI003CE5823B